jgi:flavin-dependent dehydrogenase
MILVATVNAQLRAPGLNGVAWGNEAGLTMPQECEVLIIGGGPAGSTVAALLAEKGRRVVLLEKARHPRFHIGESLLPLNLPLLARLGVLDQVREIGIVKFGAEFNDSRPNGTTTFYFADALDKSHPYAYQVRRAEFDHLLLQNAAAKGAEVLEGVRVTDVRLDGDRPSLVSAQDDQGIEQSWQARFLVDASGRDTFLSKRLQFKQKSPRHQSAAIFSHFKDVIRRDGKDAGNISIAWFPYGWFWMIPLRDGSMSVGAVCWPEYLKQRKCSPEDYLWQTIALCPAVQERMTQATMIAPARATGNYSYFSSRMYGDGFLLVGDAYAFVDPVFSSGVLLAMYGAARSADVIDNCLRDPQQQHRLLAQHKRTVDRGIRSIAWFIYRFNSPAVRSLFMKPRKTARIQQAVISVLAGDFFGATRLGLPLALFKVLYYAATVLHFSESMAFAMRKWRSIRTDFHGGTTPDDAEFRKHG